MTRVVRIGSVALLATSLAVACDEAPPTAPTGERAARVEETERAPRYRVIEVEAPGSIAGQVRWTGPRPDPIELPVRVHASTCGETQPSPALRVSARGGVADVVLALEGVREGVALTPPATSPTIAREGCVFTPHVSAVGVGWELTFVNRDPIMHNVRGRRGERTVLDLGLPEAGESARAAFDEAGPVRLVCDVGHTWEHAWVHVFEHPYFAVSDAEGRFRISDVPPGRYQLRVWHEGWRAQGTEAGRPRYSSPIVLTRSVSVSPRQETSSDFELGAHSAELAGE